MTGNVVFMYFYYLYRLCLPLMYVYRDMEHQKGGIAASCASYFESTGYLPFAACGFDKRNFAREGQEAREYKRLCIRRVIAKKT
jgi:hypothetical protein